MKLTEDLDEGCQDKKNKNEKKIRKKAKGINFLINI